MRIVFVGGGTGGHFYPLIAVAEEVEKYARENKLLLPKMYYLGPEKFDEKALYDANIRYIFSAAGKLRRDGSILSKIKNFFSWFLVIIGVIKSLITLYFIYPDVIFSKGAYASFPTLVAGRILGIPVVVHDSDATLGRVTKWSAKFAVLIGIAFPEAVNSLTEEEKQKTAIIGSPLRKDIVRNPVDNGHEMYKLDTDKPVLLILGGSSGAEYVNNLVIDSLEQLIKKYQVIHQVGSANYEEFKSITDSILSDKQGLNEYRVVGYLNRFYLRGAYSIADICITRSGTGTLFELAEWQIPSILIPITSEVSHDQIKNAYSYARQTGVTVIEQKNLNTSILLAELEKIHGDKGRTNNIKQKLEKFSTPDAAAKIANQLISILKTHEA